MDPKRRQELAKHDIAEDNTGKSRRKHNNIDTAKSTNAITISKMKTIRACQPFLFDLESPNGVSSDPEEQQKRAQDNPKKLTRPSAHISIRY